MKPLRTVLPARPALVAVSAGVALSVALTGCSDKGTSGSEAPASTGSLSDGDAAALVKQAADASKNVTSTHFELTTTGTIPDLPVSKVSGDLQNKPTVAAKGTATVDVGKTVEGKFFFTDGKMYADITGGRYVDYGKGDSIYDVSALFDEQKGIPNVLSKLTDAKSAGKESIDGAETEKITGTVAASDVAAISGSRVTKDGGSTAVATTVWIQPNGDHQLVRISIVPVKDATLAVTFSQWGSPVTVTKPSVAPVEPQTGGDQKSLNGN